MRLRISIVAALAVCLLVPLLSGYGVMSMTAREMFGRSATAHLEASSTAAAKAIDERLAQDLSHLKTWSALPVMQDALVGDSGGDIGRALESFKANYTDFTTLTVTDARGKAIATTSKTARGVDYASDEGFRAAQSGRIHQSAFGYRSVSEPDAIAFSVPLRASYDRQTVIGTITGAVDFKAVAKSVFAQSPLTQAARADQRHFVVARRSDNKIAFTSKVDATLFTALQSLAGKRKGKSETGTSEIDWKGATHYVASAATSGKGQVQDAGFVVRAILPSKEIAIAAESATLNVSIAAGIAALAVLALAWRFLAPVSEMANAMDRIARGETGSGGPALSARHPLSQMSRSIEVFRRTRIVRDRLAAREQELHQAAKDAEAAALAKAEHLASLSREVRTQLNTIIGLSELINTEVLRAASRLEYAGYAKDIARSGVQLLAVINDLFDLSEAEAGHSRVDDSDVDLTEIVRDGIGVMTQAAERAKVSLACANCEAPFVVRGDVHKLKQVLFNLLSNAIKFTPEQGRVHVLLRVNVDGQPTIVVEDTGIGMPTNLTPIALTPFTTANETTHGRHGAGLGLPLVKRLIELHGGTVQIDSEVGLGTTVTVALPAKRLVSAPAPAEERLSA
jgi:signal transduction histidine kinase